MVTGFITQPCRKTLFTTDLDGTMLIPIGDHFKINVDKRLYSPASIAKTEDAVKKNNIDCVLINTGRNYTELCEVQNLLEATSLPVTAIALEDGKRLLTKPQDMSSKEWINKVFDKNLNYLSFKDKFWTQKNNAPLIAIGDYLNEKGFIHRNDNGEKMIYSKPVKEDDIGVKKASKDALWIVTIVPPGINFEVNVRNATENDEIDVESFNKKLTEDIYEMLKNKGFDISDFETKKKTIYINSITREDVNKGKVADYYRSKLGTDIVEIRAGNAENDSSMLHTSKSDTQVIQVGDDIELRRLLSGRNNVTQVPNEELGRGITEAYKKLNVMV